MSCHREIAGIVREPEDPDLTVILSQNYPVSVRKIPDCRAEEKRTGAVIGVGATFQSSTRMLPNGPPATALEAPLSAIAVAMTKFRTTLPHANRAIHTTISLPQLWERRNRQGAFHGAVAAARAAWMA